MRRRPESAARKERRAREKRERRLISDFLPPEGVPLRFEVATLGSRFAAQLIDLVVTALFAAALPLLLLVSDAAAGSVVVLAGSLLFFLIRAPYYVATELVWNGQTLGKRIRRLRVVSADGRSLRPWSVAVRNIMKELEVFVPGTALFMAAGASVLDDLVLLGWIAILLAVPLTNRRRQRLGDIVAGTYVIRQPEAVLMPDLAESAPAAARGRFVFLPHQLDHYGAYELQTLEQVLRTDTGRFDRRTARRHRQSMVRVAENIRKKIDYTGPVPAGDVPEFLEAFYLAQRRYLENRKLFGDARADKFHREDRAPAQ